MNGKRLSLVGLVAVLACSSSGPTIVVDVVTDYSPGTEFQAVRTSILRGPSYLTPNLEESDQFLEGRRVATFDSNLSVGDFAILVELIRPDGSALATQTRSGTVRDTTSITSVIAVFTRNCQGLRCAADEYCLDEACVGNACDPMSPSSDPDGCDARPPLTSCPVEDTNVLCTDGVDNDRNGFIDCDDFSCSRSPFVTACAAAGGENTDALCSDGVDNDRNGYADCADFGCSRNSLVTVCGVLVREDSDASCSDGVDNDLNGFTDCGDFSCSHNSVVTVCGAVISCELSDALCSDGMDNDMNGFTDCDDFGCSQTAGITVCGAQENTNALCQDGVDNDMNGFVDCEDLSCSRNPAVSVCME